MTYERHLIPFQMSDTKNLYAFDFTLLFLGIHTSVYVCQRRQDSKLYYSYSICKKKCHTFVSR